MLLLQPSGLQCQVKGKWTSKMKYHVLTLGLTICILSSWIHDRQPDPYMDELFHVPQAQRFCRAIRTQTWPPYDGNITTPPGLYVPNAVLSTFIPASLVCSTRVLRFTNALMSIGIFLVTTNILKQLRERYPNLPKTALNHNHLVSLCITVLPVSFFFSFLFYTDTPSILYILLAWSLALQKRFLASAIAATLASMTRQTNIVWHVYIVIDSVLHELNVPTQQTIRDYLKKGLTTVAPHIPSAIFYFLFLIYNGGVALGDKTNHKETIHYVTIAYLSLFHTIFHVPIQFALNPGQTLQVVPSIFRERSTQAVFIGSCAIATSLVLATSDYVHPFVLSDNRHLMFYVYRRWLGRSNKHRLLLVPFYAIAPTLVHHEHFHMGGKHNQIEFLMIIMGLFCSCMVLLPTPLLEPRYFIVPNLFLTIRRTSGMKIATGSPTRIRILLLLLLAANLVLVYIFAEFPFHRPLDPHMPEDSSPGRFML